MKNTKNFDWNRYVKEALERTEFMALSTIGEGGSWTCPVYFSYNEQMSLYFKSMPSSRHMKNIKNKPDVSAAIFSTNRLPEGGVAGIQIAGKAEVLSSREEVDVAAKHHYGRSDPDIDYKARIEEHLGEDARWNFVKIVPAEAWYFDTRFFDEETEGRQKVPLSDLRLEN